MQHTATAFDRQEMLDRLGGDVDLLQDVLEVFLEECPKMMAEITLAVSGHDANAVRHAAHSMKGALLNISANAAAAEAKMLEDLGAEARLGETGNVLDRLRSQVERLQQELENQAAG